MERAIKAMFNFLSKSLEVCGVKRALAVYYSDSGIGCPYVANAVYHLGVAFIRTGVVWANDGNALSVHSEPDDLDAISLRGSAAREKQKQQNVSHIHSYGLVEG